jgi:GntR family transcriptional regulator
MAIALLIIDKKSRKPIYEQIVEQIKTLIVCDVIKVGDKLESVRSLSSSLGVNPNTIQKAYSELENQYICQSSPGRGRFVTADAKILIKQGAEKKVEDFDKAVYSFALYGMELDDVLDLTNKSYQKAKESIDQVNLKN